MRLGRVQPSIDREQNVVASKVIAIDEVTETRCPLGAVVDYSESAFVSKGQWSDDPEPITSAANFERHRNDVVVNSDSAVTSNLTSPEKGFDFASQYGLTVFSRGKCPSDVAVEKLVDRVVKISIHHCGPRIAKHNCGLSGSYQISKETRPFPGRLAFCEQSYSLKLVA